MDKSSWDKVTWRLVGNHLGYSRDEPEPFKANPRNEAVLDLGRELQDKRIVIEVVELSMTVRKQAEVLSEGWAIT